MKPEPNSAYESASHSDESTKSFPFIQSRTDTDYGWKHDAEIEFFNRLVLDLKLGLMGRSDLMMTPITMERLAEADKHLQALQQCRERQLWT